MRDNIDEASTPGSLGRLCAIILDGRPIGIPGGVGAPIQALYDGAHWK